MVSPQSLPAREGILGMGPFDVIEGRGTSMSVMKASWNDSHGEVFNVGLTTLPLLAHIYGALFYIFYYSFERGKNK